MSVVGHLGFNRLCGALTTPHQSSSAATVSRCAPLPSQKILFTCLGEWCLPCRRVPDVDQTSARGWRTYPHVSAGGCRRWPKFLPETRVKHGRFSLTACPRRRHRQPLVQQCVSFRITTAYSGPCPTSKLQSYLQTKAIHPESRTKSFEPPTQVALLVIAEGWGVASTDRDQQPEHAPDGACQAGVAFVQPTTM